jgi:lipopolysaccharide/colanic/teichoic acid biosynthesis glycosyltransferase
MRNVNIFLKRLMDIVGSLCALTILGPITLIGMLALFFESGWPVVYWHERVGLNGKLFRLYKIRSMVKNADEVLWSNPELLEQYKKNGYKLHNDPRVTKVGKILRRYDIEEVPQFFNVLMGEMSIVGPRAYKPNELQEQGERYPDSKTHIEEALTVKPGITGLWQISGRNYLQFDERIKLDASYAKNWNIFMDIKILIMTPIAVFRDHGD